MSLESRVTQLEQNFGDNAVEIYFQEIGDDLESIDLYTVFSTGEKVTLAEADARLVRRKVFILWSDNGDNGGIEAMDIQQQRK